MKARRIAAALACVAAGVLAAAPGAAAKPGYVVEPEHFSLSARLPKSNGYSVHLGSVGHRWIELAVHRRGQLAIYLAKGRVNRHRIDVDFGRFGHIRADFTGRRMKSEPLFPGCDGQPAIKARGRLEGSFRFRGEGGFVNVSTTRARASYERSFGLVCYFGPETARDREVVDVLEATGKAKDRKVYFQAAYLPSIGVPVIAATTRERIDRVIVVRLTMTAEEGSALELSPPQGDPQTATVKPTFPFRGSASYFEGPDGSSEWSGDLRVPMAGLGQLSLTEPSFKADVCRVTWPGRALTCKRRPKSAQRPSALANLLYGRGSHSQPLALARLSSLR